MVSVYETQALTYEAALTAETLSQYQSRDEDTATSWLCTRLLALLPLLNRTGSDCLLGPAHWPC
jgi:hypothetical protein